MTSILPSKASLGLDSFAKLPAVRVGFWLTADECVVMSALGVPSGNHEVRMDALVLLGIEVTPGWNTAICRTQVGRRSGITPHNRQLLNWP